MTPDCDIGVCRKCVGNVGTDNADAAEPRAQTRRDERHFRPLFLVRHLV
jgi:hypothetical protein